MSLRIDSTEWISGALLIGETGLGVLGSAISATGGSGASYLYNDLTLPADANKEICGRITTWPASGTLYAYENGNFTFTAADGSYSFLYQLYVDGVAVGTPATVSLVVGAAGATQNLAANLFANTNAFYAATVSIILAGSLYPSLLTNINVFYPPSVGGGVLLYAMEFGIIPFENRTGVIP